MLGLGTSVRVRVDLSPLPKPTKENMKNSEHTCLIEVRKA